MNERRGWWRRLGGRALDLLYPPLCEHCGIGLTDNCWLCSVCAARLPRISPPFCTTCGEPFFGNIESAFSCANCQDVSLAFDFARAALNGDSEDARSLVHALKYRRGLHLGRDLAVLMAAAFTDPRLATALEEKWPLIPIPLHPKRLRHRHFNQAGELAHHLGRRLELPVVAALRRVRATPTQTRLTRKHRLENLSGAFALAPGAARLSGSHVILIDDVLTTGATSHECAKVLKAQAGVTAVAVVTLLRS
jgi:ComF family protein